MKQANPLIWGGVLGLVFGALATIGPLIGIEATPDSYVNDPFRAAFGGLSFGVLLALVKNWLGQRR